MRASGFAALVGACLAAVPAQAVVATYQTNFVADFTAVAGAPVPSATGAYKVTYNSDTRALTLVGFVLNVGAKSYGLADVIASATPSDSFYYPYVLLSGTLNGTSASGGTYDFSIGIDGPNRTLMDVGYATPDTRGFYVSRSFTLSAYNPSALPVPGASVPEPAGWALMIAGFGLTGAAMRRRRARVAFG
ncbi:PEPxxWA-CTERM sorting domain-containing protein [Sphingomonas sp. BIUV-7]|uniref:PEPxxWA-CTERM sorting domain-containing protein n=1 Tax=Sphingomonas natans TaxID=3063330 RepID=A0ABT8YEP2_9SPHN|nr:PEPxxWA-CTERM sorting domain-containing protein [Sphingomonas sp. BIUV-7]MDO6416841.1 PEPxxWA-CTERM sorting domain-containing protein [Sphingomonas sp. BIUV-7]